MSANDNTPTIDPHGQSAAPVVRHDEPEPDITSTGSSLVRALLLLSAFVFIAWAAMANLYKVTIARETLNRATVQDFAPASRARTADVARATSSGETTLEDGTVLRRVPVSEGAALLLANPNQLRGSGAYNRVEGAQGVELAALPTLESVLDPEAAAAAAAAAEEAAAEAAAEDTAAADAQDAPEAAEEAVAEPAAEEGGADDAPSEDSAP